MKKITRRNFLRACGAASTAGLLASCTSTDTSSSQAASSSQSTTTDNSEVYVTSDGITLPLVAEPVTLDFLIEDHATKPIENTAPVFAELARRTNVYFNFIKTASGYDEKLKTTLASGNLPDLMQVELSDALNYGPQGAFMDLRDLFLNSAPNVANAIEENDVWKTVTAYDDGVYVIPKIQNTSYGHAYMLRSDWMDAIGMNYPTSIYEYYDVLKAFKDEDVAGNGRTVPFGTFELTSIPHIAGTFNTSEGLGLKNDTVVYGPLEDEYKEMLQYLNTLYSEGLMDNEFVTLSKVEWEARVATGEVGSIVYNSSRTDYFTAIFAEEDPDAKMVGLNQPLSGPDGEIRVAVDAPLGEMVAVAKDSKNADIIAALFNYVYSEEGRLLLSYGIEGDSFNMVDGVPVFVEEMYETDQFTEYAIDGRMLPCYPLESLGADILQGTLRYDVITMQEPYTVERFEINNLTQEEIDIVSNYMTNITDVMEENTLKFIIGRRSFDEWDAYVAEIEKQGIAILIDTYQTAYNRLI